MGALTVLYLVLPFPIVFIVHELEEIFTAPKWMKERREALAREFPKAAALLGKDVELDRKGYSYAVLEELIIVLFATFYLLEQGPLALQMWSAMVLAYSVHVLYHLYQLITAKSYVPGIVTAVLSVPFCVLAVQSIWTSLSGWEIILCTAVGTIAMLANLALARKIGAFFSGK